MFQELWEHFLQKIKFNYIHVSLHKFNTFPIFSYLKSAQRALTNWKQNETIPWLTLCYEYQLCGRALSVPQQSGLHQKSRIWIHQKTAFHHLKEKLEIGFMKDILHNSPLGKTLIFVVVTVVTRRNQLSTSLQLYTDQNNTNIAEIQWTKILNCKIIEVIKLKRNWCSCFHYLSKHHCVCVGPSGFSSIRLMW